MVAITRTQRNKSRIGGQIEHQVKFAVYRSNISYSKSLAKASCQDVRCPGRTRCVLDVNNKPRCQHCGCALSRSGLPVCGSDGKKYKSWCYMRRHSCLTGRMIRVNPLTTC